MADNFTNLERDLDIQVHEAHKFLERLNPKTSSPKCIMLKMSKIKENFKSSKTIRFPTYQKTPMKLLADFSSETLQTRGEG